MAKSLHLFILVLYVLQSTIWATKFSSLSLDDECSALLLFKNSVSTNYSASYDPSSYSKVASWKLNSSEGKSYCCLWDGVECSGKHVIELDLSSSFLYGPIYSNTTLFTLLHLRRLNLADNDFRFSQIPSGIGRLSQLANLNLSFSAFSGLVPKEISHLTQLVSLDLSGNWLNLRSLVFKNLIQNTTENLRELFLSEVNIDSQVPRILANSSSLRSLVLQHCGLHGELPTGIFQLPALQLLDVQGNGNLNGKVPASIGNLINLNQLDLSSCSFSGPLPGSISNLTQLTFLDLYNNSFWGRIPSLARLSKLSYLDLSINQFDSWKLPDWLGKLNKLTFLHLYKANLYGEIPSSIFNLTQLGFLRLSCNQIEGPIPPFPSTMTKLTTLKLSHNQLKGPIPSSLSNLKNIVWLLLNDNDFSGTVEADIFVSLKQLKHLNLGRNRITLSVINNHTTDTLPKFEVLALESCNLRVFPDFLRFQDQLQELYLDNNKIEGRIPAWMGNCSKETLAVLSIAQNSLIGFEQRSPVLPWVGLRALNLSHNMLYGSIPMPPPTTLNFVVSNNKLIGEIPPSVCDLQSLRLLDLSFNNITGLIPPCLEKLNNSLLVLNLRGNSLRGTIPDIFRNGSKLLMINLSENQLEGQLPRSLENCASLQILDLGKNRMEGMFPFWLGALSELQVLILRSNKFHGSVRITSKTNSKFPKLHVIDLSYNSFSGDLPLHYFPAMKKTESIATYMETNVDILVANKVLWDGNYSFSMQMCNKGVTMEYQKIINIFIAIDLSSNKFQGKIPESIKSLNSLRLLNLSNNELVGVIPSRMGILTKLESLDLSSNKLSGKIPQELAQLNFLEFLNVSYNNLTGPIPQGEQFKTFLNTSYLGNSALCGDPLSKKCGNSEVSKPPAVSVLDEDVVCNFPSGIDWVVILSGVISGLVIGLLFGNHLTIWFIERFVN